MQAQLDVMAGNLDLSRSAVFVDEDGQRDLDGCLSFFRRGLSGPSGRREWLAVAGGTMANAPGHLVGSGSVRSEIGKRSLRTLQVGCAHS